MELWKAKSNHNYDNQIANLIVATLCWLQLQLFAWPSICKVYWHPFVVCQISGVVSSFGIRKIKVVSEEARSSVSSGNKCKVTQGDSKNHSNCMIMTLVGQKGGCIQWHWPLLRQKKVKALFYLVLPDFHNSIDFWRFPRFAVCPSGKSCM